MANNNDDMFDAESLLSLLNEIQTNPDSINSLNSKNEDAGDKKNGYYPGMIKIAADALDDKEDEEWTNDIIDIYELEAAKKANAKHVVQYNIDDYSPEIFSDQQLKEIRLGIEHKVQVDEYADVTLTGRQMREIRYGLERNLDINLYKNKFFRERQMKEIRIGLQDGLDVESYAKIVYSATDMRKKRMKLFCEKYKNKFDEVSYDYDDVDTGIHIYVEPGLMEAGIVIKSSLPEKFTRDDLKALMNAYDISYGFNEALIPQNLSNLPKGVKIPIMFGKESVAGKDGFFEYAFPIEKANKPKINEDGTVDYTPTRTFKNVKRGETIVTYHPAEIGENGITVTGIEIEGFYGKNLDSISSDDLIMSRDKTYYMAKKDGFVSMVDDKVKIMDNLTFKEDVTYYNGKITFDGNIQVNGSVRERSQIYATGDIIVTGYVESAIFVAGGDIVVTGGINADENGSYVAKGNITAGFFENANASAGGNIETSYILNSNIIAGGVIKTKGKKSLICGGKVVGREGIYAGTIGSNAGTKTYIEIGGNTENDMEEYNQLINERKNDDEEIERIHSVMDGMVQKLGIIQVKQDESYIKLQRALEYKKETREKINKKIAELDAKRMSKDTLVIEANREMFENVTLNINGNKLVTQQVYEKATFRSQGRKVVVDAP